MRDSNDLRRPRSAMRRKLIAAAALLPAISLAGGARAQQATDSQTTGNQATADQADFLFVQTAAGMAFDASQNRLTLRGVSPVTLFFSDRPERIAGNMKTEDFVPFWSDGTNSFLSDPPNADVSVLDDGKLLQTVVVLHDPVLENGNLRYTVKIIDGEMPELGDDVSLFIDIIGMPLTPLSFAGVRRRTWRRAVFYR